MRRVAVRYLWDRLRVNFWFTPAIMSLLAVLLAWLTYWLDVRIPNAVLATSRFVLTGTAAEQRSALLGIAGIILATAGVVFTLLTLPLSTVAAQYGSRLLRLFLGDRITQFVLGMFVATFVYCMAAAMSIPGFDLPPEAPQLTATVGLYLALVTFATLVGLIQHISTMLQAPNIAAAAGAALLNVIRMESESEIGRRDIPTQADHIPQPALLAPAGFPIGARDTGYVQTVDPEIVLTVARERDLVVRLLRRPGDFVRLGSTVALVWPADHVDQRVDRQLQHAFRIGNQRSPAQDLECAVNQLVEMAVRAMSPAINDPFTAMTCLDHMGTGLALFVQQGEEIRETYDKDGHLRLVLEPVSFAQLLGAAFDMLRHASRDNASVMLHMLSVIDSIGEVTELPPARQLLLQHAELVAAEVKDSLLIEADLEQIRHRAAALRKRLAEPG